VSNNGGRFEEGTPEFVVQVFVNRLENGQIASVGDLIADDAKGTLKKLRDGDTETDFAEKLKTKLKGAEYSVTRNSGVRKLIVFEKKGKFVQFFVVREKGEQKIVEIKIPS
jgi:hypothetical protein